MEAIKKDKDKTRVDLLDAEFLEGVGDVLRFGSNKYSDNNWRLGFKWSRLIAACLRHLLAIMRGEDTDPESGYLHVYHLGCSCMFLAWHMRHKPELDGLEGLRAPLIIAEPGPTKGWGSQRSSTGWLVYCRAPRLPSGSPLPGQTTPWFAGNLSFPPRSSAPAFDPAGVGVMESGSRGRQ